MNQPTARIDYRELREALRGMHAIHQAVAASTLEPALLELVKFRVSQINGCGYCLDMHSQDARAAGETEQRLYGLSAWREAPYYSPRERAALALAEEMTLLHDGGVPEVVLDEAERHFDAEELRALLFAVVEINGWNRLAVTARTPVGSYRRPAL